MRIKIATLRIAALAERGYTIAELCVSTLLVVTVFVGLYAGISSGFAYTQALRENLRATQIMLERMEGIRLYNWSQINSNGFVPATFTAQYYPAIAGTGVSSGITYTGRLSITPVALNPAASYAGDMRLVTVSIGWLSSGRGSNKLVRTREMQTYVGRYGMQNYIYHN